MPLEIRELNIQVNVGQENEQAQQGEQPVPPAGKAATDNNELIKQCVEEVMHIINAQKER